MSRYLAGLRALMNRARSVADWFKREFLPLLPTLRDRYHEDRVGGLAAEIAFFGVLSLFPGILALVAILGFLDRFVGLTLAAASQQAVIGFLEQVLTRQASGTIDAVRALFENQSQGIFSFAVAGSIWAMSRGTLTAMRGMSVAYGLPIQRSWFFSRLKALGLALGTIVIMLLMLTVVVVGPFLGLGSALAELFGSDHVATLTESLRYPMAFVVLVLWALTLLHFGPNHRSPAKWDLPGAVLTSLLWLTVSSGLRLYLELAGTFNRVFGVLGGAITLMIWFYLLSMALLLGAELNAAMIEQGGKRAIPKEEPVES